MQHTKAKDHSEGGMELRALLKPWYSALRHPLSDVSLGDATLWLRSYSQSDKKVASILEGIELLGWLALASIDDYRAALCEIWKNHMDPSAFDKVGLQIEWSDYKWGCVNRLPPTDAAWSTGFIKARCTFEQAVRERKGEGWDASCRPEVKLCLTLSEFDSMASLVREIQAKSPPSKNTGSRRCFNFRYKVEFPVDVYAEINEGFFEQLRDLMRRKAVIVNCRQPHFQVRTPQSASNTVLGLQAMLQTRRQPDGEEDENAGIQSIMLDPDYLLPQMAPRLLSAIPYSRSLQKVWIGMGVRPTNHVMRWLGFALFSIHARNNIQQIEVDFTTYDVWDQLFDVIRAEDPVAIVFEDHAASIREHRNVRASASKFVLYDPLARDSTTVDASAQHDLRVISHEGEWWSVLLPGWGRAWIHDRDALITATESTSSSGPCRRVESSLEIYYSQQPHMDEIEALFHLCGTSREASQNGAQVCHLSVGLAFSTASSYPAFVTVPQAVLRKCTCEARQRHRRERFISLSDAVDRCGRVEDRR